MPWCPKCGIEYRDGFKTCNDCGCELSENPVPVQTESASEGESATELQFDQEAFLVSTGSSVEAEMIEGLLNADEIPVLKKYGDGGDYLKIYLGGVTSGVDLYVPSHLLVKAKEILDASQGILGGSEIPEEELEAQALAAQPEDEDIEDEESEIEEPEDDLVEEDLAEDEESADAGNGDEESANAEPEGNIVESLDTAAVEDRSDDDGLHTGEHQASEAQENGNNVPETGSLLQRFISWLTGK
jgi:hypothetical protein